MSDECLSADRLRCQCSCRETLSITCACPSSCLERLQEDSPLKRTRPAAAALSVHVRRMDRLSGDSGTHSAQSEAQEKLKREVKIIPLRLKKPLKLQNKSPKLSSKHLIFFMFDTFKLYKTLQCNSRKIIIQIKLLLFQEKPDVSCVHTVSSAALFIISV